MRCFSIHVTEDGTIREILAHIEPKSRFDLVVSGMEEFMLFKPLFSTFEKNRFWVDLKKQ